MGEPSKRGGLHGFGSINGEVFSYAVEIAFGGRLSKYMLDDSPRYHDALNALQFYALLKKLPPEWAVKRWAMWQDGEGAAPRGTRRKPGRRKLSSVVNDIRALAVELCPGPREGRGNVKRYERAAGLLRKVDAPLFYGLYADVMAGVEWRTIKKSYLKAANRHSDSRYLYAGLKDWLRMHLPLLVEALEMESRAPDRPQI